MEVFVTSPRARGTIPSMTLADITTQLRDPATFKGKVVEHRGLRSSAKGLVGIGIFLIGFKVVMAVLTVVTNNVPWRNLSRIIFSTNWSGGRGTMFASLALYLGPALLVLGIVLFLIDRSSAGAYGDGLHRRFVSGGYVARQVPTGYTYTVTGGRRGSRDLVFIAGPAQTDEQIAEMQGYLYNRFANLDKKEGKRIGRFLGALAENSAPVQKLFPDMTADVVVAGARPNSEFVAVVPQTDASKPPQILAVRA